MAKKMADLGALAHTRRSTAAPVLPGALNRRAEQPAEPVEEPKPEQAEAPAEEPATEAPAEKKPETKAPAKKAAPKATSRKAPAAKSAPAKSKPATAKAPAKSETKAPAESAEKKEQAEDTEELVSLDGRPARLWDISGGQFLPEGWAAIAVDRVVKAWPRSKAFRRNAMLPDNIYQACHDYIYQQVQDGGLELTLSNLAEAAFEQIPMDDPNGIQRLLDDLPDQYYDKSQSPRPRTFQLLEPTFEQLKNLARMLRAQGFNGRAGLVQAAVLRELLIDLGMDVD